jgi:hypothetical protein
MPSSFKIEPSEHLRHPLRVHALLHDYELEDVWRFPISMQKGHSLDLFLKLFKESNDQLLTKGLPGMLFKFRMFLGRVFRWDEHTPPNQLVPGTLRHRYAMEEELTFEDLPDPGTGQFVPVYQLENEFLSEIENKTVKAALHLSRVPMGVDWCLQMAVYVQPRGAFGRFYMALIKPFRLWIVYPSMLKQAKQAWEEKVGS